MAVESSQPPRKQRFVPGVSSQASAIVANAAAEDFWHVSTDTAIWLKFGVAPVAADGDTHFLPAGASRSFSSTGAGEKIAVLAA
jgi:hypothetical protein